MLDLEKIEKSLKNCPCGREHKINIRTLEIGENITEDIGSILRDSGFVGKISIVWDKNTKKAAEGVDESVRSAGLTPVYTEFDDLRLADMASAERVENDISREGSACVLSVGTGSLNDICRITAAKLGIPFAIYATAPSMDGFASVMAPITINGFKRTYPAKAPEVIAADTRVLAKSPAVLKAAGLGDLLGKYTAHADWEISTLTTGEYYCGAIAKLTRDAVDRAVALTRQNDTSSAEYGGALMEALVLSGLAMLLSGCTRPASGAEHHLAHFWEMKYALEGREQVYHGKKVGIATGIVADIYNELAEVSSVREVRREIDTETLSRVFGSLWNEAVKENVPNPLDSVKPGMVEDNWDNIRNSLRKVPKGDEIRALIRKAGGEATCAEAGIPSELERQGMLYGRYARFRITMMRLLDRIDYVPEYNSSYGE
jgi:glycerol-1-phosphate dehydrogenase [NAD(P)+]